MNSLNPHTYLLLHLIHSVVRTEDQQNTDGKHIANLIEEENCFTKIRIDQTVLRTATTNRSFELPYVCLKVSATYKANHPTTQNYHKVRMRNDATTKEPKSPLTKHGTLKKDMI